MKIEFLSASVLDGVTLPPCPADTIPVRHAFVLAHDAIKDTFLLRETSQNGKYSLPGGKLKFGELSNATIGAAREFFEETGLKIPSDELVTEVGKLSGGKLSWSVQQFKNHGYDLNGKLKQRQQMLEISHDASPIYLWSGELVIPNEHKKRKLIMVDSKEILKSKVQVKDWIKKIFEYIKSISYSSKPD